MNEEDVLVGRGSKGKQKKVVENSSEKFLPPDSSFGLPLEFFLQRPGTSDSTTSEDSMEEMRSGRKEKGTAQDEAKLFSLREMLQKNLGTNEQITPKEEIMVLVRNVLNLQEGQLRAVSSALQEKKRLVKEQIEKHRKLLAELEEEEGEEVSEEDSEELEVFQMIGLAQKARLNAHVPYSNFHVGCVLKTESGVYYTGCNVENASYGLAICAERTAIVKAVSEGHRRFQKIVVASDLRDSFITPCGACRQFMAEFGDCDVYLSRADKKWKKLRVSELLPHSFTNEDLEASRY